jgi:hypothetical protein
MYLQIFTIKRAFRIAVHIGIAFTAGLYGSSLIVESYFQAPHVGQTWEILAIEPNMMQLKTWIAAQGALIVLLDVYIFLLPLPIILRLHLPVRRRVQLTAVFLTAAM